MKINPKHNKIVGDAAYKLRNALEEQTIELLKLIGAETFEEVVFDKSIIMLQQRKNGLTETIIADRISYNDKGVVPYYVLELAGQYSFSYDLSISSMQRVYDEVYKIARNH